MQLTNLDTPALVVDLDVLEKNIRDVQHACDALDISLRVHTKTHKTPAIARKQIEAGAIGIVCQKVGEAEAMVAGGLRDILIPYNILGHAKLERLSRLIRGSGAIVTVAADSTTTIAGLSQQAAHDGYTQPVVVEMDTGSHRCGVQSPSETLDLAQRIHKLPGLEFMGVMTYAQNDRVGPFIDEVRHLTAGAGLPLHIVSGGGTGSQEFCKSINCTETRIGSYAYEGMTRIGKREDLHPDRCPLRVVVTVVSNAVPDQVIVDAGQKAFASYAPTPYGYCIEHPEIYLKGMSVEHGHVDTTSSDHKFAVGETLSFIPLHGGMTTNLYDRVHATRAGEVIDIWSVAGRGCSQ